MTLDTQNSNMGIPGQTTISFQALINQLANNNLQLSQILNTLNTNLKGIGLIQFVPVPATSASAGAPNQVAVDATHFYFFTGSQWLRVTGSTF
jgi:hypothetical protein